MSARKLQQEFDKINKKIAEGLSVFDDIHDKLVTTEINSQKEKLESDLKKEIKKLQRSRDQLKSWLNDTSIKLDKNLLQENRTKIEHAMDQFKDLEKSSKIKQFSNEGLELQSLKTKKNRFAENSKAQESCDYISDVISQLEEQNADLEAEIESVGAQMKKTKSSYAMQSGLDDVKYKIERNKQHLSRLEVILENLENEKLDPEKIDDIKDDLDYYVENNQDEDYVEYDDFYDQVEVAEDVLEAGSLARMVVEGPEALAVAAAQSAAVQAENNSPQSVSANTVPPAAATAPPPAAPIVKEAASTPSNGTPVKKTKPAVTATPPVLNTATSYSNAIKAAQQQQQQQQQAHAAPAKTQSPPGLKAVTTNSSPEKETSKVTEKDPTPSTEQPTQAAGETESHTQSPVGFGELNGSTDNISRLATISQSRLQNPLPFQSISHLLETSLLNCPDSFDAEKPRQYNPVNIHPSGIDYPQEPMYELDSSQIMRKFDNDTLFFCFYYSDDTFAKWNAVKELTRRGWIFHKGFKQWFMKDNKGKNRSMSVVQREEESGNNEEVEADGESDEKEENYKYFDYEKTWLTRRRENFQFSHNMRESFV